MWHFFTLARNEKQYFICIFARVTKISTMKKYISNSGFASICIGVLMLLIGYAFGWTNSNAYSLSAAFLVVAGAIIHIYLQKRESKY